MDSLEWNGMEWNGMEWNGMEWNGMDNIVKSMKLIGLKRDNEVLMETEGMAGIGWHKLGLKPTWKRDDKII